MIVNVTWALLLLFACCRAEDVDSVDLKEDILEGQNKVKNISSSSVKAVEETTRKLDEIKNYFQTSIPKYRAEVIIASNDTKVKMDATSKIIIGEAIDKNKPIATFKCIMKARQEMEKAIVDGEKTGAGCVDGMFNKQMDEVVDLTNQLQFISAATNGLYDTILNKLAESKTSAEVTELVHKAEARENSLKKLVRAYTEKGADFRIQYNDGQLACIRKAQVYFDNVLKNGANKMKAC